MASWFERKIARPIKDAVKFVLAVQDVKEHPYAPTRVGQVFDPFGYEKERGIVSSRISSIKDQWFLFNTFRSEEGLEPLTYPDWYEEFYTKGMPFGDYSESDEENAYLQYIIIAVVVFVFLNKFK